MKLHFYCFAFLETLADQTTHTSRCYGFESPQITLADIAMVKERAQVNQGATLIACSYLGHMTADEFSG